MYRNINIDQMMAEIESVKRFDELKRIMGIYNPIHSMTYNDGTKHYHWYYTFNHQYSTVEAVVDKKSVYFIIGFKSYDKIKTEKFNINNLSKSLVNIITYGILSLDTDEGKSRLDFILNGYNTENIKSMKVKNLINKLNSRYDRTKVTKISIIDNYGYFRSCCVYSNTTTEVVKLNKVEIDELSKVVNVVPTISNYTNDNNINYFGNSYDPAKVIVEQTIYDAYNEYANNCLNY